MSVLELTVSYTRSYARALGELEYPQATLSLAQKKRLVGVGITLFVLLTAIYLVVTGSIVTGNLTREALKGDLAAAASAAHEAERNALAEGKLFTPDFFIAQGYTEPQALDTITRVRNVAQNSTKNLY